MHKRIKMYRSGDVITTSVDPLGSNYIKSNIRPAINIPKIVDRGYSSDIGKLKINPGLFGFKNGLKLNDNLFKWGQDNTLGKTGLNAGLNTLNRLNSTLNEKPPSLVNNIRDMGGDVISQVNPLAGAANSVSNIISGSIFGSKANPDDTGGQIINTVADAASMFGPIGMAAGLATKLGVGALTKKVKGNTMSGLTEASNSYDYTKSNNKDTKNLLFGSGKYKRKVANQQNELNQISDILKTNQDAIEASNNRLQQHNINYNTGLRFGKEGLKLPSESDVITIQVIIGKSDNQPKSSHNNEMNVIPDGKLHAHNHNMSDLDPMFSTLSKKGIPVVKGNYNGQPAEIEKEEIIFTLEVTNELERLHKLGTEDAMIEAGKLLTHEILNNTLDFTNKLINDEDTKN